MDETPKQALYVLHAKSGRFLSSPNNPSTAGTLTLFDPDPDVIRFSSVPIKAAQTISLHTFLLQWDESFAKSPPNAGFVFYESERSSFSEISATLSHPTLDPVSRSLNFTVEALGQDFGTDRLELEWVTLFIDYRDL